MQFKYAFQNYDKTRHVRASLREKTISHKHAREIAVAIKGKTIDSARSYLMSVTNLERAVPFRRYPTKAASEFLKLLDNLESNAEYRGMDLDRLKIINATVHKGRKIPRFMPRAMGRATPKIDILTHVELVAQEI